jgi:hypothetical protein
MRFALFLDLGSSQQPVMVTSDCVAKVNDKESRSLIILLT